MTDISQVFNLDPASLVVVVVRTVAVYFTLLVLLRVAGKRELGQMTPFDLVVLLIISNAVQNAMVGPDTSLTGGLLAVGVLVLVNYVVDRFALRLGWLGRQVIGTPTLLVHDGQLIPARLKHEGLTEDE